MRFVNVWGILIGLAGVVTLVVKDDGEIWSGNVRSGLLIAILAFLYGFNTNHAKFILKELDGTAIVSIIALFLFFNPPHLLLPFPG